MLKKIFYNFQNSVGFTLINLIIVVYTLKYLGTSGRGSVSLFLLNVSIIQIFTAVIGTSSIGFVVSRLPLSSVVLASTLWTFLVSIFTGVIMYYIKVIPFGYFYVTLVSAVLFSIIQNFMEIFLIKNHHFKYNLARILQPIIQLILVFVFIQLYGKLNVADYIHCLIAALIVNSIYTGYQLKSNFYLEKIKRLEVTFTIIFKIGIVNQLNNLIQLFNLRITFFFINKLLGVAMLGFFSIAILISESVWMFSKSVSLIFFSEIVKKKDSTGLKPLRSKALFISFLGTLVILAGVLLLPDFVFVKLFGADFSNLKAIIIFFVPGILIKSLNTIYLEYNAVIGKRYVNTRSSVSGFVTMAILGYVLTYKFGLYGAATASSISQISSFAYLLWAEKRIKIT
ncbi:MAG TPA: polysaccharide biosynthesis C-terminal domain-containing protein [Pelobium sp.]|nr:polysaccharide biosynthesis C-terminal domain-containing protein [Pelobium sp.]